MKFVDHIGRATQINNRIKGMEKRLEQVVQRSANCNCRRREGALREELQRLYNRHHTELTKAVAVAKANAH